MHRKRGVGVLFLLLLFLVFLLGQSGAETTVDPATAIDVGLNKGEGVKLNFVEDGATRKVLEVNLGQKQKASSSTLSFLITDVDFDATQIKNEELLVKRQREVTVKKPVYDCTTTTKNLKNGSMSVNQSCDVTYTSQKKMETYWEPVPLGVSGTSSVKGQVFRYSFDVPLQERADGSWGSTGKVYVGVNGKTYVNLQGSSWWDTSFWYRAGIDVTGSEPIPQWYTLEVSGLDTTDAGKWNQTNPDNFAVVCDEETELDKLIGNQTDLTSDGTTKLYPDSTGWGTTNTTFLFRMPSSFEKISSSTPTTICYVYYGDLAFTSSENNMSEIALLYDDFNRPNSSTVGNGWTEGSTDYLQIARGSVIDIGSSNGVANRPLDVGTCSDCEKYEVLLAEAYGGTSSSDDIYYTDIYNSAETGIDCGPLGGLDGICTYRGLASSIGVRSVIYDLTTAAVVKQDVGGSISPGENFSWRSVSLDATGSGDYQSLKDESSIPWNSKNSTQIRSSNISNVKIIGQRPDDVLYYIMVQRYMDKPPKVTVGGEETSSSTTTGEPCYSAPILPGSSKESVALFIAGVLLGFVFAIALPKRSKPRQKKK